MRGVVFIATEQRGYPAFRTFPVTGPFTSPPRPIDATTGGVRVTLSGSAFSARIQISNAQAVNTPAHLFLPAETDWETYTTVTQPDAPAFISPPVRWARIVLDSGTITGGNIEESTRVTPMVNDQVVEEYVAERVDVTLPGLADTKLPPLVKPFGDAIGNTTLAQLSTRSQASGPQFVDGSRWLYAPGGTPNGGTVIPAQGGGVWVREYAGPLDARWFGADPTDKVDSRAGIQAALEALAPDGELSLPRGRFRLAATVNLGVRTLVGEGEGRTILVKSGLPAGTVMVDVTPNPPLTEFFSRTGELLSGMTLEGGGEIPTTGDYIGMRLGGTYKSVRNIKILGFTMGMWISQSNTYLVTAKDIHIFLNQKGLVLGAFNNSTENSGENILIAGGVIHDNTYNVVIQKGHMFTTLRDVSLDYPRSGQFLINDTITSFQMNDGHIEHYTDAAFITSDVPGIDIGLIQFNGVDLVFATKKVGETQPQHKPVEFMTAADLFTDAIGAGTIVMRNCTNPFTGTTFSRVVAKGRFLPAAVAAGTWTPNTARVPMLLTVPLTVGASGTVRTVEIQVRHKNGTGTRRVYRENHPAANPGGQETQAVFRVEPHEEWQYAAVGITLGSIGYDLLAD